MEVRHGPNGPLDNRASQLCYGTPRDNSLDRERDGTDLRGARIAQAKLTDDIVRQCRARYAAGGVLLRTLADEHGVAMGTMSFAIRGITWRHVA
jgi:hypothetical protein